MRDFPVPGSWVARLPRGEDEKAPTKLKLWMCRCTRVRCAVELNAECRKCGKPFKLIKRKVEAQ